MLALVTIPCRKLLFSIVIYHPSSTFICEKSTNINILANNYHLAKTMMMMMAMMMMMMMMMIEDYNLTCLKRDMIDGIMFVS